MTDASDAAVRSELDQFCDQLAGEGSSVTGSLSADLFAVADTLDQTAALRRALTDPNLPASVRGDAATAVLTGKVGDPAVQVVARAAQQRWTRSGRLADELDRLGVRAQLVTAEAAGALDEVEDELFRLGRIVEGNPELQAVLADRSRTLGDRQQLIAGLVADRARPETTALAQRAVAARGRTFNLTLAAMLKQTAALRGRSLATVRVAAALDDDQVGRIAAALSRQVGRPVSVQQIVDPDVIGGARIELGDEVIEGTMAGRLAHVKRQFGG